MSDFKEDIGEFAILMLVFYCLMFAAITYPCLVIGYYFDEVYGVDEGFYAWLICLFILWILKSLEAYWLIAIIYIVTLIPFILICVGWYKECYS